MNYPQFVRSPYAPDTDIPVTLTPDIYWDSQPIAVQALRAANDESVAADLAKQGYAIDHPIMVWGWDPVMVMILRLQEGYTWVPNAMQPNIPIGPGIENVWNLPSYDPNNPPPGSIKVSVSASDYPPAIRPAVVVPQNAPANKVGTKIGSIFGFGPGAYANGKLIFPVGNTAFSENGVNYVAVVGQGLMGLSGYIELAG